MNDERLSNENMEPDLKEKANDLGENLEQAVSPLLKVEEQGENQLIAEKKQTDFPQAMPAIQELKGVEQIEPAYPKFTAEPTVPQQPVPTPPQLEQQPVAPQQPVPTYPLFEQPVAPQQPMPTYPQFEQPVAPQQPMPTYPQFEQPVAPQQPVVPQQPVPAYPQFENPQTMAPQQQAYQQFEGQQGQPPYGSVQNYSAGGETFAAPPKKSPVIMIIIIALSLVVLGVAGFAVYRLFFYNSAKSDPVGTLDFAVEKTQTDMLESRVSIPNFSKFAGKPSSESFELTLKDAPDMIYFDEGSEINFGFGLQTDAANQVAMLAFSLEGPGVSIPNSKVYITPDETTISSDFIYDKPLTIDNDTFIDEWNRSDYSSMMGTISIDGTLKEGIQSFFDMLQSTDTDDQGGYDTIVKTYEIELKASAQKFKDRLALEYKETTDTEHILLGVVSGADLESYIEEVAQTTEDMYYTALKQLPEVDEGTIDDKMYDFQYMLDEVVNNIYFEDDVQFTFYIDKETKGLNKLTIEPTWVTIAGSDMDISLEAVFSGEGDIMENMEISVELVPIDSPEEKIILDLNRLANVGGVRWELISSITDTDMPEYNEKYTMFLDYNWDKKADNTNNFFVKIGYKEDGEYGVEGHINLRGRMLENEDSISFSDAEISVVVDGMENYLIGVDYTSKAIESGSITMDRSGAVKLFSVSADELLSGVMSNLM